MTELLKRHAAGTLHALLEQFPAVVVLGARQTGKSTLVSTLGRLWQYFDLEKGADLDAITSDADLFFERNPDRVVIDEAQEVPRLFPALRAAIDQRRGKKGRFVITGSSSPTLLRSVSETLAGRVGVVELGTLTPTERWRKPLSPLYAAIENNLDIRALEALQPVVSRSQLFQHWLRGGYPEPALLRESKQARLWMDNYRTTYLYRDVRRLFPRLQLDTYRRFLGMLARLSGSILNHAALGRALNVSQPTAHQYADIAAGTFLWRRLEPYTRNVQKRVTKMPRGHLRDSGLLHFMLNLGSERALMQDPIVGRSWEAFVTETILKGLTYQGVPCEAYYYRTQHGAEIDLILEGQFGLLPIEIKLGTTVSPNSLRALREFMSEHKAPLGLVITNAEKTAWLDDRILRLPATVL